MNTPPTKLVNNDELVTTRADNKYHFFFPFLRFFFGRIRGGVGGDGDGEDGIEVDIGGDIGCGIVGDIGEDIGDIMGS